MTNNFFNRIQPLSPILGLALAFSQLQPAQAHSLDDPLNPIYQSMRLCLLKASRPGFPYYNRPEASESCNETKSLIKDLAKHANRNRNLRCYNRATILNHNLWMIQFLGGTRMEDQTLTAMENLRRSCYKAWESESFTAEGIQRIRDKNILILFSFELLIMLDKLENLKTLYKLTIFGSYIWH